MRCRGIRGATTVEMNSKEDIMIATRELLEKLIESNKIDPEEIASVFFTTSSDLNAEFPAVAARQLGWTNIALLCGHEMSVPGSLSGCIRVLILYNTEKKASEISHVYLNGAKSLRAQDPFPSGN